MYISNYTQIIDKQLNSVLHERGPNTSQFSWFLALQLSEPNLYDLRNDEGIGNELLYESIGLASAPTASFYTQHHHFSQNAQQADNLQKTENPSLLIHFYNCIMPQSLSSSSEAILIPEEVIDNTSLTVQKKHNEEDVFGRVETLAPHYNDTGFPPQSNSPPANWAASSQPQSDMPTSAFANSLFESILPLTE